MRYTFLVEKISAGNLPGRFMLMYHRNGSSSVFAAFCRLLALIVTGSVLGIACSPQTMEPSAFIATPTSLGLTNPLIGKETSPRDPAYEPTRLTLDEESVMGWLNPPSDLLRFPVDLSDGAWLSVRLGADGDNLTDGDLVGTIAFRPWDEPSGFGDIREIGGAEIVPGTWISIDIDLGISGDQKGEIRLQLEGPKASDDDIRMLWGEPSVYYPDKRRHRNVLLIGIDTLRLDGLSIYGGRSDVSPNIELLSRAATVFTHAWSQAPWTVPSFESMITGLYPADIAPTLSTEQLPESATTLAEILLPEGFATGMVCGNVYLGNDKSGFHQGMEGLWFRNDAEPGDSVVKAIEFIERAENRDWFLFLHIMDPHGPYDPPERLTRELCDPDYSGEYQTEFTDGLDWQLADTIPPREDIDRVRCLYDAEVCDVDSAIADLYSYLRASDLLDETLIILAADHGEEFFEHGDFEHGQSLHEEQVHLPLIVWASDFPAGERIGTPVANLDIAPTIFEFLDEPIPDSFRGKPLGSSIDEENSGNRIIMGEGNLRRSSHRKFAVDWPYKCILDFFTGEKWLYNLEADPMERDDLSELYPGIAEELSVEMITGMLPVQTMFVLAMIGDTEDGPERFNGSVNVPGGVGYVIDSGFLEGDSFSNEGETIDFDFSTEIDPEEPIKALIIVPAGDSIELSVLADGQVDPNRFFPYATPNNEPTGSATVDVHDLPWPARIPADAYEQPVALYIIGIPGFPRGEDTQFEPTELDPETREALRALGYIN